MIDVPAALRWWARIPGGAAWLSGSRGSWRSAPARGELQLGERYPGEIAYVTRAMRADGTPVVLKLNFPEPDSEHEAAGLRHWRGHGAVRLLADDPEHSALLLARCEPGTQLPESAVDAVAPGLLRRLWLLPARQAAGSRRSRTWRRDGRRRSARWASSRSSRTGAPKWLDELVASAPEALLVNQDLHRGNVLRDGERWLVIDPKPVIGERALDLAALGRNRPDPAWLRRLAAAAGVHPERARRWAVVHTLAWAREL